MSERSSTWNVEDLSKRGIPTQELINVYDKWGHGGFGVIITGNIIVDPRNLEAAGNMIICRENDSPLLRKAFSRLADAAKQDGALVIAQLSHAGRQTPVYVNKYPYSCSDKRLVDGVIKAAQPVPLALDQIKTEVIDRFVYAAKIAYETDEIFQFRNETSERFILGIKTNSVEFQPNGLNIDDAKAACSLMEVRARTGRDEIAPDSLDNCLNFPLFQKSGFDFVELSGGTLEKPAWMHERVSSMNREAFFMEFAEKVHTNTPQVLFLQDWYNVVIKYRLNPLVKHILQET
ncbi:hypothetical protein ANCDUO_08186 [Ancylostoma duodenale]|uniref:Uncharacterized protein n=1 Tax=Ancylostoma duodenale TaxID=51022 RepID=A0A0C2GWN9_9BILA|nr:hypothetical protein ANCDUO_08186 [Ancylostoma duodenale]